MNERTNFARPPFENDIATNNLISSIPFQTVHVGHSDAFEERDDQQGEVSTEIVE